MGEKKRKGSSAAADLPHKKSKPSKNTDSGKDALESKPVSVPEPSVSLTKDKSLTSDNASSATSKKSRKRAADFMNDEEESNKATTPATNSVAVSAADGADEPGSQPKKSKKRRRSKQNQLLSADGVNGVVEHTGDEDVETATAQHPISSSLQAEAERTVDQELEEDFGGVASEDEAGYVDEVPADDNAAALLAGFDSDAEDNQEDTGLDGTTVPGLPHAKKVRKKLDKIKAQGNDDGPGTVYVGRIPHGFYEAQMREYFSQFGDITKLRLSRNKRTGASKHFAFIEFGSNEVAKIVAETMDNYLLFGHLLKCKYAPADALHPDVWKGANKKYRKIPHEKLERESLATPKTAEKWQKKVEKEQRKREQKAQKLKALGLELPTSTLTQPSDVVKEKLITAQESKLIEQSNPEISTEPAHDLPITEGTEKESKKSKKDKKGKKDNKNKDKHAEEETKSEAATEEAVEKLAAEDDEASTEVKDDKPAKSPQLSKKERKALSKAATIPESELSKEERKKLKQAQSKLAKAQDKSAEGEKSATVVTEHPTENKTRGNVDATQEAQPSKKEEKAAKKLAKKAAKEAAKASGKPAEAVQTETEEPILGTDADFVSFGEINNQKEEDGSDWDSDSDSDADSTSGGATRATLSNAGHGPNGKKFKKEKKPKKDRKNLVKARGPKSKLTPATAKPEPSSTGKLAGIPLLGKAKYNKAARQAHKELKNEMKKKKQAA